MFMEIFWICAIVTFAIGMIMLIVKLVAGMAFLVKDFKEEREEKLCLERLEPEKR